jgi:hypothetical protein
MLFSLSPVRALVGVSCLLALTTCRHPLEPYQTERFDLSAAPAAAEGYPMEVEEGRFIASDGSSFPISGGFLEGDWGLSHIGYVSGDGKSAAPDSMEVRWFSYPEDKFYEGHFLLPQRRIHDLLKQGFWNTDNNEHEAYTDLTVCLLPKGVAVVWLAGRNQVLLGRYEGREVAFDFKRFNPAANRPRMIAQERALLPAQVQAAIRTGSLSTRQWDTYLKTYRWNVAFSQPLQLYDFSIHYVNAEADVYPPNQHGEAAHAQAFLVASPRPVPSSIVLSVEVGYGRKRKAIIRAFDESETQAAFQTLHAANPTLPLTLYVETDARVSKARLFLQNERQQVALDKTKIELYEGE